MDIFGHHTPVWEVAAAGAAVIVLIIILLRLVARLLRGWNATLGVKLAAVFALMATAVSMNTNWRFFGGELGITNVAERAGLFGVVEGAMLTFAVQARENKLNTKGDGTAGPQGTLLWVMSGLAMLPAWIEAGAVAGTVRALIGPFLAALLWHYALGLELQRVKPSIAKNGVVAALVSRTRESLLATLGAAQPDQSALEIRQDRALNKAARLADKLDTMGRNVLGRRTRVRNRLRKAVRLSGAGTDPARRRALVELMHTTRTADQIARVEMASPWALAAAQIEAEQSAAEVVLEPAPAVAGLETAPIQDSEGAPRIDRSTYGALVGALAEAVSAQLSAPNQAAAHPGAAEAQDGHTVAQLAAPNTAPMPETWFEVPVETEAVNAVEPVFELDGAPASVRFVEPVIGGALPAEGGPDTGSELETEAEDGQEEDDEDEESEEEQDRGRLTGRAGLYAGLDALGMAGDVRVFGDERARNAVAYEVNRTLPRPISEGTVRRYAADYVKMLALFTALDKLVAAGDLRVFNEATRDAVADEVNVTLPGGPFPVRTLRRFTADYVEAHPEILGANSAAPVTDEAESGPFLGGEFVTLPRQLGPDGAPVAADGAIAAQ